MNRYLKGVALGFGLFGASLFAQEPSATPEAVDAYQFEDVKDEVLRKALREASHDPDLADQNAIRISLGDAIDTAVKGNLGVQLDRFDIRLAEQSVRFTHGAFDMFLTADLSTSSSEAPVSAQIFASKSDRKVWNFGLSQGLVTGGRYSVLFNNSRQGSNSVFTTVNPAFLSEVSASVSQPLLRNFGTDVNLKDLRIARNTLGINQEDFRNILIQTIQGVEQAYFDLIYARQNLQVKKQSLALARDQERITQIRIDVGASAPLDILQPRVAIATREEEVILAQAQVRDVEDRLRQLMNLPADDWAKPVVPTESLDFAPIEVDPDGAVKRALKLRPEIRQIELGTNSRKIESIYARNQVLPTLDLSASYGVSGLAGTARREDPVTGEIITTSTGWGDAVDQAVGGDFPGWSVALNFGVPIRNIGAKANARRAELELDRAAAADAQMKQIVTVEVRKSVRDIDTAAKEITATRTARDAAGKNLEAERKRFQNGMTTNFNLLLIQQDLADARSREILALANYKKAVVNLHRSVGDLLEVHSISLGEEQARAEAPYFFERFDWLK